MSARALSLSSPMPMRCRCRQMASLHRVDRDGGDSPLRALGRPKAYLKTSKACGGANRGAAAAAEATVPGGRVSQGLRRGAYHVVCASGVGLAAVLLRCCEAKLKRPAASRRRPSGSAVRRREQGVEQGVECSRHEACAPKLGRGLGSGHGL